MNEKLYEIGSDEFPRKGGNSSGSCTGYSVEATSQHDDVLTVMGQTIIKGKWKRLNFKRGEHGIPAWPDPTTPEAERRGLFSYGAAQALRWWLYAERHSWGLKTRLVEHRIEHSTTETIVRALDEQDAIWPCAKPKQ